MAKRIVESIPAAAELLGIDPELVKRAKRLGCPAFKAGSRIDIEELRKWISANEAKLKAAGDNLSLKDQKLNEEIRKLRIANDLKEGTLVDVRRVIAIKMEEAATMKPYGEQLIAVELPSACTNETASNRIVCKRKYDQFLEKWQSLDVLWKALDKR